MYFVQNNLPDKFDVVVSAVRAAANAYLVQPLEWVSCNDGLFSCRHAPLTNCLCKCRASDAVAKATKHETVCVYHGNKARDITTMGGSSPHRTLGDHLPALDVVA